MSLSHALIAGVALCILGCRPAPGVGTHWRSCAVSPELGLIAFTSSPLVGSNSGVIVDPHAEFCCVLVVLPGRRGGLSSSKDEDVGRSTHSTYTFRTDTGQISFEYSWERYNDIVDIAGGDTHARRAIFSSLDISPPVSGPCSSSVLFATLAHRLTRWKRFSGSFRMIHLSHRSRSRPERTMVLFNARELHNGV